MYTLLLWALLQASAATTDCPWATTPIGEISAQPGRLVVAGVSYKVSGAKNRRAFSDMLDSCGAYQAAEDFESWRKARKDLSIMSATIFASIFAFPLIAEMKEQEMERREAFFLEFARWNEEGLSRGE